jgi:hypothetical protein
MPVRRSQYVTSTKVKEHTFEDLVSVVLLCDSPGYRMKSYGAIPLIPFKTKRLIDLQITSLHNVFKKLEIVLCVGYDADRVCKYIKNKYQNINIRIVENQLFDKSNSCESTRLCLNNINNHNLLICDGSLIIDNKTLKRIDTKKSYAWTENTINENLEIGINIGEKQTVEHFGFGAYRTWSEILLLNNYEVIENLRKILSNETYKQKFLFEALNELIKTKHNIQIKENMYPVHKINNIKTYHKLRNTL